MRSNKPYGVAPFGVIRSDSRSHSIVVRRAPAPDDREWVPVSWMVQACTPDDVVVEWWDRYE